MFIQYFRDPPFRVVRTENTRAWFKCTLVVPLISFMFQLSPKAAATQVVRLILFLMSRSHLTSRDNMLQNRWNAPLVSAQHHRFNLHNWWISCDALQFRFTGAYLESEACGDPSGCCWFGVVIQAVYWFINKTMSSAKRKLLISSQIPWFLWKGLFVPTAVEENWRRRLWMRRLTTSPRFLRWPRQAESFHFIDTLRLRDCQLQSNKIVNKQKFNTDSCFVVPVSRSDQSGDT